MIPKSSDATKATSIFQHGKFQVCYRRYASLYFVVGFDGDENELALLEWIHCLVETLDSVFSNVCELDILFHHDTVNEIIDDMVRRAAGAAPLSRGNAMRARASPGAPASARTALLTARALTRGSIRRRRDANDTKRQVYNGQFVENNRAKNLEATLLTNRFQKTSSA